MTIICIRTEQGIRILIQCKCIKITSSKFSASFLQIGLNPLTMTGITEILRAVDSTTSKVSYIDLEGAVINGKVSYMIERIRKKRKFKCSQHLIIDSEDVIGVKIGQLSAFHSFWKSGPLY